MKWEQIGPPDCPIMWRWTALDIGKLGKVLVHRFTPNVEDRDYHDHPRPFVTFVLRGGYDDLRPDGTVDRVRAPAARFRRAEYAHITRTGASGALTVVVMGPLRREWGFWRGGRWWQWRAYEQRFGFAFRCADLADHDRREPSS